MSWEDLMTHVLTTTTSVEKMVIFDPMGMPIAVTEGVETSDSEGLAISNCLNDPAKTLTKLTLDNSEFICIQGIHHSLIGTAPYTARRIFVAHQDPVSGHVLVLTGQRDNLEGSFISVLKRALILKEQGQLLNPERLQQQQQQLLPVGPPGASPHEVLVDI